MTTAREHEIETYSGEFVNTRNPDPATIRLLDIAHALSHTCRYGGHCRTYHSVAEHAVFVSKRIQRKGYGKLLQLAGLHHDDSEAYLGDIPRPLKPLLGKTYKKLTDRMDKAIIEALGFSFSSKFLHSDQINEADNWALFVEARYLLPSQGKGWADGQQGAYKWELELPGRIVVPDYWHGGVPPERAKRAFIDRHRELTKGLT